MLKRLFLSLPLVLGLFVGIIAAPVWAETPAESEDSVLLRDNGDTLFAQTTKEHAPPSAAQAVLKKLQRYCLAGNVVMILKLYQPELRDEVGAKLKTISKASLKTQGTRMRYSQVVSATDKTVNYSYRPNTKYNKGKVVLEKEDNKWWIVQWLFCGKD